MRGILVGKLWISAAIGGAVREIWRGRQVQGAGGGLAITRATAPGSRCP